MLDPLESFRLDGKVAVVTGASSGLGVVFAETLAGAGAKVVVSARRLDRLEKLAEELRRDGAEAMAVQCDVLDESDIDRLVTTAVDEFGSLDIMVANAGLSDPRPAEDEPLDVWHRIVGINLTGVFLCAQRAGRVMLDQESGSIVNVASVLGQVGAGQVPQASYSASKGGVVNLTRELAAQWARRGVRVNLSLAGLVPHRDDRRDVRSREWLTVDPPQYSDGSGRGAARAGRCAALSRFGRFELRNRSGHHGGWRLDRGIAGRPPSPGTGGATAVVRCRLSYVTTSTAFSRAAEIRSRAFSSLQSIARTARPSETWLPRGVAMHSGISWIGM